MKPKILIEIKGLERQLSLMINSANYLMGKRKGSWGLRTKADEYRQTKIERLSQTITILKNSKKQIECN